MTAMDSSRAMPKSLKRARLRRNFQKFAPYYFMLLPAIPDSIKMMTPVVVSTTGKIRDLFTLLFRIDAARNSQTTLPYCMPIAMTAEVCRSASTIDRHKDA